MDCIAAVSSHPYLSSTHSEAVLLLCVNDTPRWQQLVIKVNKCSDLQNCSLTTAQEVSTAGKKTANLYCIHLSFNHIFGAMSNLSLFFFFFYPLSDRGVASILLTLLYLSFLCVFNYTCQIAFVLLWKKVVTLKRGCLNKPGNKQCPAICVFRLRSVAQGSPLVNYLCAGKA